jgi:hypothetical protein
MKKTSKAVMLISLLFSFVSASCAASDDFDIYKAVISTVVMHEKPAKYFIWNQYVDTATILTPRVPLHEPEQQLVRNIHGLPAGLERELIRIGQPGSESDLVQFDVPPLTYAFGGFTMRDTLHTLVERNVTSQQARSPIVVGVSHIAYSKDRNDAVLYAESCLTLINPVCGGEGFWFRKQQSIWTLKKHAFLWQGSPDAPFWNIKKPISDQSGAR